MVIFVRNVTALARHVLGVLIICALNAQMDIYKTKHLLFRAQKNVLKLVLPNHINKIIFVRYVIVLVSNASVVMIIRVLNVQMVFFQMNHLLLKALKNVSINALQEPN